MAITSCVDLSSHHTCCDNFLSYSTLQPLNAQTACKQYTLCQCHLTITIIICTQSLRPSNVTHARFMPTNGWQYTFNKAHQHCRILALVPDWQWRCSGVGSKQPQIASLKGFLPPLLSCNSHCQQCQCPTYATPCVCKDGFYATSLSLGLR